MFPGIQTPPACEGDPLFPASVGHSASQGRDVGRMQLALSMRVRDWTYKASMLAARQPPSRVQQHGA
ncbi:hypothetical protein MRX96_018588 [Rhipicephalus microplus]